MQEREEIYVKILQEKKIVAMTTTGASKFKNMLQKLNFKTVIIEEAAEILEAHVTALLKKGIQQMVLIGDH